MTLTHLLSQAARMTLRDWRAGELRLLATALVIAVAAVTSVGFFVDRIRLGLERDARQLLGADLVISSDSPLQPPLREGSELQFAETVTFPSMALSGDDPDRSTLAAVKAVSPGYPLRGTLLTREQVEGRATPAGGIPEAGTVWVDPQAVQALGIAVGAPLKLGEKTFRVARVIAVEPDRGAQFINFAPRVMLNLADLPATELIQPGSRVTYRLLVAGEGGAVSSYRERITPLLKRGQEIDTLEGGQPQMQRTMERAERFLSLVALLAAMVAAVAVAASARRFSLRHLDSCAMMRCLGLAQADIFRLFALEFVFVGLAACLVGMLLGFGFHFVLLEVLGTLIRTELPLPSLLPAVQGFVCGMVLLLGFALPPLVQLRRVPPLRVLRKDLGAPSGRAALGYLLGSRRLLRPAAVDGQRPEGRQHDRRWLRPRHPVLRRGGLCGAAPVVAAACDDRTPRHLVAVRGGGGAAPARRHRRATRVAVGRTDGAVAADRHAHGSRQRLACGRPPGCAQPLRHQHPAGTGGCDRVTPGAGRSAGRGAVSDGARAAHPDQHPNR
jgi:putative ABC transport system permease protein